MSRSIAASIPYVNAIPHIGHALELIEVDAVVRYWMQQGEDIRGQFGSDDNSLKNVRAAKEAGESVDAYVARHSEIFKGLLPMLNISFSNFIRTRDDAHIRGAQKLWSMFKKEDVETRLYEGLYCVGCEAFYDAADLVDGTLCPVHKKPVEAIKETNYFFKLSNYQSALEKLVGGEEYIDAAGMTHRMTVLPVERRNEMLAFVKRGLQDFSISRSVERAENWGVPVPGDASQVMYVWVDALSNYINGLGFADDTSDYATYWTNATHRINIVGKDIIRFHAIYWPAFLLSAGLPIPTEIFAHGFLTVEGEKMSKSIGNVIAPQTMVDDYGVDATRYMLLKELPYGQDGDISKLRLEDRYAELANGLGNLVSRVAAMVAKSFPEGIGAYDTSYSTEKIDLLKSAMTIYDFRRYLEIVWEVVADANEKIDKEAPFKLVKVDRDAAGQSLATLVGMIRWIGAAMLPIIPASATEILRRYESDILVAGEPLFPRRDR